MNKETRLLHDTPGAEAGSFSREVEGTLGLDWLRRSRRNAVIIAFAIGSAILAGSLIKIDVFATAVGQISPDSYTRAIDAPRTGYVRRLLVGNGGTVRVGQPIVEFDCRPEQAQHSAALAHLNQLQEQLDGQVLLGRNIVPGFAGATGPVRSDRPRAEAALRSSLFEESRTSAFQAVRRAEARVAGAQARLTSAGADRRVKQAVFERMSVLNQRGFATRAALDERVAAMQQAVSEVDLAEAELDEARDAVRELRAQAARTTLESQSRALDEIATTRADLLELRTEIARLETALNNCVVNAPATGHLFWLNSLSPGTWVRADERLSKVVPQNQPMIVQAVLRDQDIPFVHVGQRAMVKLNSLPFVRYGTLSGHVRFVSPDTITDESGDSAYRIEIEVTSISPEAQRALPNLIPGMEVEVNVITDNRRLIEYFFDPILVALQTSFHER